jgi:hypothetical protein
MSMPLVVCREYAFLSAIRPFVFMCFTSVFVYGCTGISGVLFRES